MNTTSNPSKRDRFALQRIDLLNDYARISKRRPGAVLATALRENAPAYVDIMAVQASRGKYAWDQLREMILDDVKVLNSTIPGHMLEISVFLMLRPTNDGDRELGARIIRQVASSIPPKRGNQRARQLLVEHEIVSKRREQALTLLDQWTDIDELEDGYLRAELDNPFQFGDADIKVWLGNFNRNFAEHGLWPITVDRTRKVAFDGLRCEIPENYLTRRDQSERPLITVVVPTYQPVEDELLTAVKSICAQTLSDIEIIIVDDASGPEYKELLERVANLDERIRLINAPKNCGAYVARNIGYMAAQGEFVTGQDDDDWSHPERLAIQLEYLRNNPDKVACRVGAITCLPNLSRVRYGYKYRSPNASTLMLKTADFRKAGGFLPIRKAADTEFFLRLQRIIGKVATTLDVPLTLVRITPDSLSRSEFMSGWSHPARRNFKTSYHMWHRSSASKDLVLQDTSQQPVSIPRRFMIEPRQAPDYYDVVFAGNWQKWGGPQKSMYEEIQALREAGLKLAILDLNAARFMSTKQEALASPIQKLINNHGIDEVFIDDAVSVNLLILRYPPILQFMRREKSELSVKRMIILANQAPSEVDGSDIRYLVNDCHDAATTIFTNDLVWAPQGPQVREAIEPYLGKESISSYDIPGIVNANEWFIPRSELPRGLLPVIGRYSRDDPMKWPNDPEVLVSIYPTNGSADVRIMGGLKAPLEVLGISTSPEAWTSFTYGSIAPQQFLQSIDFFVFFQHPKATEAFGRSILEAIASGVVVILPQHFEEVFGDAALYCSEADVASLVRQFHENRHQYMEQIERARRIVADRFSYAFYVRLIQNLLSKSDKESQ